MIEWSLKSDKKKIEFDEDYLKIDIDKLMDIYEQKERHDDKSPIDRSKKVKESDSERLKNFEQYVRPATAKLISYITFTRRN